MKNFKHFWLLIICVPLYICCKKKELIIVPIESLNSTRTVNKEGKNYINKTNYFLVKGYDNHQTAIEAVNKFIVSHKDTDYARYDNYSMFFYKESDQTTIENIKTNPKIIDRYSNENDLLYDFLWNKGKFIKMFRHKGGVLIEPDPSDIILSPAPPADSVSIK